MIPVKAQLELNVQSDQDKRRQADGKTDDVQGGIHLALHDASECDQDVIFQHSSTPVK